MILSKSVNTSVLQGNYIFFKSKKALWIDFKGLLGTHLICCTHQIMHCSHRSVYLH